MVMFRRDRGRLSRRRSSIARDTQFGVFNGGNRKTANGGKTRRPETQVEGEGGDDGEGKNRVRAGWREVIAPLKAVLFAGALDGHEVVTHGDNREEDRYEDQDGDDLATAIGTLRIAKAKPEANHQEGESGPSEIEKDFH